MQVRLPRNDTTRSSCAVNSLNCLLHRELRVGVSFQFCIETIKVLILRVGQQIVLLDFSSQRGTASTHTSLLYAKNSKFRRSQGMVLHFSRFRTLSHLIHYPSKLVFTSLHLTQIKFSIGSRPNRISSISLFACSRFMLVQQNLSYFFHQPYQTNLLFEVSNLRVFM